MKEAALQAIVTEALTLNRWRWVHFRPAQAKGGRWLTPYEGDDGFPDLIAVKGGTILVLECKGSKGKKPGPNVRSMNAIKTRLRYEAQEAWIEAFSEAGAKAMFATPENLDEVLGIIIASAPETLSDDRERPKTL